MSLALKTYHILQNSFLVTELFKVYILKFLSLSYFKPKAKTQIQKSVLMSDYLTKCEFCHHRFVHDKKCRH